MSEFVPVIDAAELPPGACKEVRVGERALALCNAGGEVHAIDNTCPHRGGPLGQGTLHETLVICPWHNWAFDVTTGISPDNPELRTGHYETKVEDGRILVRVDA